MYKNCYEEEINTIIDEHINSFFNLNDEDKSPLKTVVKYALNNGKRIRPAIGLDIYNTLNKDTDSDNKIKTVFLAIEYIHSASLVIDDLPCMDNATTRRQQMCIHKKYGEATAQLTATILLALASNALLIKDSTNYPSNTLMMLLNNISNTLSITAHGQLLDLSYTDKDIGNLVKDISTHISVEEIISKKTGLFFESAFLTGWLLGKGDMNKIDDIKRIAFTFSMAFQIVDDIEDRDEDLTTNKKNVNQNYAIQYGIPHAINKANEYLLETIENLKKLNLYSAFFKTLLDYLSEKLEIFS